MSEALELAKALVEPINKLIDTARRACGKLYEPIYTKKMADAKAYEARKVAEVLRESSDIPIVYDKGDITMDTTEFEELAKRAQSRMAYQELVKQGNIESVIANAYELLEGESPVTGEPVNSDWIIRFFNSVEDISDEQMQKFWGELLAGEIKQPNTFSLRTLEVLKNLTPHEADVFSLIAPFILHCPGDEQNSYTDWFLIPQMTEENRYLVQQGITCATVFLLTECGLMSVTDSIGSVINIEPDSVGYIYGQSHNIKITNCVSEKKRIGQKSYLLTEAGKQLLPIALSCTDIVASYEYYEKCAEVLYNFSDKAYINGDTSITAVIE